MSDLAIAYVVDSKARMATQKYAKVRAGQAIGSLLGVCVFWRFLARFRLHLHQNWCNIPFSASWSRLVRQLANSRNSWAEFPTWSSSF